jgi:prophage regulatory protein
MNAPTKLLRLRDVMARTGLAKSTLYRDMDEGNFPRPCRIGARSVAWPESLVQQWIDDRIKESERSEAV